MNNDIEKQYRNKCKAHDCTDDRLLFEGYCSKHVNGNYDKPPNSGLTETEPKVSGDVYAEMSPNDGGPVPFVKNLRVKPNPIVDSDIEEKIDEILDENCKFHFSDKQLKLRKFKLTNGRRRTKRQILSLINEAREKATTNAYARLKFAFTQDRIGKPENEWKELVLLIEELEREASSPNPDQLNNTRRGDG